MDTTTQNLQEIQQKLIEQQQKIDSIKTDIDTYSSNLKSLSDKEQKLSQAIKKLPEGKVKIQTEINKITLVDDFITITTRLVEDAYLELKFLTKVIDEEEYNKTKIILNKKRTEEDNSRALRLEELNKQLE